MIKKSSQTLACSCVSRRHSDPSMLTKFHDSELRSSMKVLFALVIAGMAISQFIDSVSSMVEEEMEGDEGKDGEVLVDRLSYHRRDLERIFFQTDFHKICSKCSKISAIFPHFFEIYMYVVVGDDTSAWGKFYSGTIVKPL